MAGCAGSTALLRQELAKSNTQTVLAFEETVYNKHEVQEGFEHYVGTTYQQHDVASAQSKDAAMRALTQMVGRFPNSHLTVRRTIAQGNMVAVQLQWSPELQQVSSVERVDIYRLENGRIVERWEVAQNTPTAGGSSSTPL